MKLYTNDLLLKTVNNDDIDEVARIGEFEKGSISLQEAQRAVENMQNNHKLNHSGYIYHICFAIYEKGKNNIIGWCGLDGTNPNPENPNRTEIFYMIEKQYRNKGYATQCASILLEYAFEVVGLPYVNGGCSKNNLASRSVMEKAGMLLYEFDEESGGPSFYIDKDIYNKLKWLRTI